MNGADAARRPGLGVPTIGTAFFRTPGLNEEFKFDVPDAGTESDCYVGTWCRSGYAGESLKRIIRQAIPKKI